MAVDKKKRRCQSREDLALLRLKLLCLKYKVKVAATASL